MSEQLPDWNSIPDRAPLQSGGGRGTGLSEENIKKVKAADIIGDDIAVVGFLILPSSYEEGNPEYALVEIIDVDGNNYVFSTSSAALMKHLEARYERDEIPFKTSLVMQKSAKGRSYYVFS